MAASKVSKKLFQKITEYISSMIYRYQKNEKQTLFNFLKKVNHYFFLVDDTEIKNLLITKNNFTSENNKIENQKLKNENWNLDSKLQKIFYQKN